MYNKNLAIYIVCFLLVACGSEDVENIPEPEKNSPPNIFDLKEVSDGSTQVNLRPSLTWNAAIDPDGDSINYDVLFDKNENPSTILISNTEETVFEFTDSLEPLTTYYWKVIAKDALGNLTESNVFSFTTQDLISLITNTPEFTGRIGHTSVTFKNQIWVIAGSTSGPNGAGKLENDVWASSDGATWTKVNHDVHTFSPRAQHTTVVFDDKLWVIGGNDGNPLNDVWSSTDGVIWTEVNPSADFPVRKSHSSVVFKNKIWVFGGHETSSLNPYDDIWYSIDGVQWNQVDTNIIPEKSLGNAVVFDNKIWIIAGYDSDGASNEVWNSSDGVVWNKIETTSVFDKRYLNTMVVFDDQIWVIGGTDIYFNGGSGSVIRYNDTWTSKDGANWDEITPNSTFSKREYLTSTVFHDKIWIIGGFDGTRKNDVWTIY